MIPEVPMRLAERMNMVYSLRHLRNGPKQVLAYLSLRHNDKLGYSWVSIPTLAKECTLSEASVKRAIHDLMNLYGLIGRDLRAGNPAKSRATFILWDKVRQAAPVRATQDEDALDVDDAEQQIADSLEDKPGVAEAVSPIEKYRMADSLLPLLRTTFAGHPTLGNEGVNRIMGRCISDCIDHAGSGEKCLEVLEWLCLYPEAQEVRDRVQESRNLGGYITKSFGGWIQACAKVKTAENTVFEGALDNVYLGSDSVTIRRTKAHLVVPFNRWLAAKLGEHLIGVSEHHEEGDVVLTPQIDVAFWASYQQPEVKQEEHQQVIPEEDYDQ